MISKKWFISFLIFVFVVFTAFMMRSYSSIDELAFSNKPVGEEIKMRFLVAAFVQSVQTGNDEMLENFVSPDFGDIEDGKKVGLGQLKNELRYLRTNRIQRNKDHDTTISCPATAGPLAWSRNPTGCWTKNAGRS